MAAPAIGCHLSLGAKPASSLAIAAQHGVECLQVFASSPGAWKPPIENHERELVTVHERRMAGIDPLFIHAIYLVNLASEDSTLLQRSRQSLSVTLQAAGRLRASGVVTHIGSHLGRGFAAVAGSVATSVLRVLDGAPDDVDLLLENSAGSGGTLGSTLEELADLLNRVKGHPALKVALDTAHLCGAGWDFTQLEAAPRLVERVCQTVGLDRLALLHANDSKVPPGSRRDRHASIGEGYIGTTGFQSLLQQPALRRVPWICETPDLGRTEADQRFASVTLLRELADVGRQLAGTRQATDDRLSFGA